MTPGPAWDRCSRACARYADSRQACTCGASPAPLPGVAALVLLVLAVAVAVVVAWIA